MVNRLHECSICHTKMLVTITYSSNVVIETVTIKCKKCGKCEIRGVYSDGGNND